jgi:MFS family permease
VNLRAPGTLRRNTAPVRRIISSPSWQGGFSSPPFRLYALIQLVTFTALVGQIIIRGWMVQEMTDSPFLVSLVPSLHLLPGLLIGPAGGYLADRFQRKWVVFWGELLTFIAYGSLALLSVLGVAEAWHVLATTALIGVAYALSSPARQALIVDTVPAALERRAVGSYMLVMHVTLLLAPAIAGSLLNGPGISAALVVTSAMCVSVLPFYLFVRNAGPIADRVKENVMKALVGGVQEIRRNTDIRWMFAVLFVMVIFINTWGAMFPTIAQDVLHTGAAGLGGITLAVGIGAITGAVLALVLEGRMSDGKQQFGAGMLFSIFVVGVALSPSYPLTLVLTVVAAACGAPFFINNMAASQAATPKDMKAKVVSVRYILLATQPFGMMLLGAAAEFLGPQAALAGSVIIGMVLMTLIAIAHYGSASSLTRFLGIPRRGKGNGEQLENTDAVRKVVNTR